MKILMIELSNFESVKKAMGLNKLTLSFTDIEKPIIQIYGKNRCGKTVLLQQLHPFSNINLSGDERSDLPLIIPGELGEKRIVYDMDGVKYDIVHTYKPTSTSHTVHSSIKCDGEELNVSGGVNTFNNIIERLFGINKYIFQFIINGTQLQSFASRSTTQRKSLLNKAMGIDIYDKIHKMAKDDYRYTSKLITSLSNTKEYLLQTYGSYETLKTLLLQKQTERDSMTSQISQLKSNLDSLSGTINTIRRQNPMNELSEINRQINEYENVMNVIGDYSENMYDKLVDKQIELNNELQKYKSEKLLISKDMDILYAKKNDIESVIIQNKRIVDDYNDMIKLRDDLENKIKCIKINHNVSASSNYFQSMLSIAQSVNGICKEIRISLSDKLMKLFSDMILSNVDVDGFLMQYGASLLDDEKTRNIVSSIRGFITSTNGDDPEDCPYKNCIYRKNNDAINVYFKSFQSQSENSYTTYDLECIDHANKNLNTIRRLINADICDELKHEFNIKNIMMNISTNEFGIDVDYIKTLIEEAGKIEQRERYVSQLSDINKSIDKVYDSIKYNDICIDNDSSTKYIDDELMSLRSKENELLILINDISKQISENDTKRMMIQSIKNINIKDLNKQRTKLNDLCNTLISAENEYNSNKNIYDELSNRLITLNSELNTLENANTQYTNTLLEIEKHQSMDERYKIIAESTSSTKGKPVIAIRDKVNHALSLTNRLLDVMYDGEIQMLQPTIDESTFSLPFRCGCNTSPDIRFGSQSESTLLSLALSLSLASSLTHYNVCLADEVDGFLDAEMSESFILMLGDIMSTLKYSQLFIISHKIKPNGYSHLVHTLDLSEEIEKQS